jgi:hypothetical protein
VPPHLLDTFSKVKGQQRITACGECGVFWGEAEEPACVDPAHPQTLHALHVHEDEVTFADGTTIVAVSFEEPYERVVRPEFGLYLDPRWDPPWPHDHVAWPDFGLPSERDRFRNQLEDLLERARRGERVELGCLGGHGRTGTALACLAVLTGHHAADAVAWVRTTYCEDAVETPDQEAFVLLERWE